MEKNKRSREQILRDTIKRLEEKREDRIDRYIIPIEIKLQEARQKLKNYLTK